MSVVSFEDVGKRYVKYEDVPLLLTRAMRRLRAGHRRTPFWALRHIDFELEPGESFGVIGRNGSGKSTMLRMLAGVTGPTEGVVRVNGRVAPLISVGVGFHRELTGRENVYVNGTILGLSRSHVDRLFDSILAFAEIEEFIDTPVKFYSSGMMVRLGFAVAIAADPEILVVDEVLAVGDVAFQLRCFERMEQIRNSGATVVVVSHNMPAIRQVCTRTMMLHKGESVFLGDTEQAISRYQATHGQQGGSHEEGQHAEIQRFVLIGPGGEETAHVDGGQEVTFAIEVEFWEPAARPLFWLWIKRADTSQLVYGDSSFNGEPTPVDAGDRLRCEIRVRMALPTGPYTAKVLVSMAPDGADDAVSATPISFFVTGRPTVAGMADLSAAFDVTPLDGRSPGNGRAYAPLEPDA